MTFVEFVFVRKEKEQELFFLCEDSLQDEETMTKQNVEKQKDPGSNEKNREEERLKDFYEECVEMSAAALERGPNKHNWFKANSE